MGWKQIMASPKVKAKAKKVMGEFKRGTLRSGKKGSPVKNRAQALYIAVSEAKKVAGVKS